jgi:hypothetical protein
MAFDIKYGGVFALPKTEKILKPYHFISFPRRACAPNTCWQARRLVIITTTIDKGARPSLP